LYPKFRLFSHSKHFVVKSMSCLRVKNTWLVENSSVSTYKVQVNTRDALIRRIRNTAAKKKNGMKQLGKQQATFIDEAENI
jgi:hypothetical protein